MVVLIVAVTTTIVLIVLIFKAVVLAAVAIVVGGISINWSSYCCIRNGCIWDCPVLEKKNVVNYIFT